MIRNHETVCGRCGAKRKTLPDGCPLDYYACGSGYEKYSGRTMACRKREAFFKKKAAEVGQVYDPFAEIKKGATE